MSELLSDLRRLLFLLGESTASQLLPTGLLSIVVALLSVLSAGSILPLVIVLQSGSQGLADMPLLSSLSSGESRPSIVSTLVCVALFALAFMFKALAAICLYRRQAATSRFIQCRLASRIHGHYLNLPLSTVVRQNPADLSVEMREGVDAASGMASHLILMAGDAAVLIGLLCLLLLLNPVVGAAVVLALALFTRPVLASNKAATRRIGAALNAALAGVMRHMADLFALSRELRVYRAQDFFRKRFEILQGKAAALKVRQEYLRALPSTIIEFSAVIIVLTLVVIMVLTLRSDEIIRLLSVYGIAAFRIIPSINRLTASLIALRLTRSSVAALVGRMESAAVLPLPQPESLLWARRAAAPAAIRLERVSYRHDATAAWLLRDVGLELAPGQTYGLYGPSGSGKSTLLDLLANLERPSEGHIEILGTELRLDSGPVPGIAYVPQSVGLIAGTVRDNILLGQDLAVDDGEIQQALRAALASEFLKELPAGLETAIGAGGLPLSGGQRKRIGIARALIRQPRLLLLDEATSSLDEKAEAELIRGLRRRYPDITILIVSHRTSTSALCNQVLALEEGHLAMRGRMPAGEI